MNTNVRPGSIVALIVALLLACTTSSAAGRIDRNSAGSPDLAASNVETERFDHDRNGRGACSGSAQTTRKSCRNETKGDYWLEVAKCQNLSDADERDDCLDDAGEQRREDLEACADQNETRLEICEALGERPYDPEIDPDHFVDGIDNPWLPWVVGATWVYEGDTEDGFERIVVEVTDETREVLGVTCSVVRDRVYLDGDLIEDTFDWYAQDRDGNVWYFGELSYELEDGVTVSLAGSWEAGVDGASPGIVMQAAPRVDDVYRQEFLIAEAEDMGAVVSVDESVTVPYGRFDDCVQTRDWTPIEPDVFEYKYYAWGVGMVLEVDPESGVRIELIDVSP